MDTPSFEECIKMLRNDDSMMYEDGYQYLQGYLHQYIDELIQLMQNEENPTIRSMFLELVGDSKNPKVIPILAAELMSPHSEVRSWAYSSLIYFENPIAEKLAKKIEEDNPNEAFF